MGRHAEKGFHLKTTSLHHYLVIALISSAFLFSGCGGGGAAAPAAVDPNPVSPTDGTFVFVDINNGSPGGAGTAADPLDDIQTAITQAAAAGKWVCVAEGDYTLDSSAGESIVMDFSVCLYGGYRNNTGVWTRNIDDYTTTISDTAASGGTYDAPRQLIECNYGEQTGTAPVLSGFTLEGAASGSYGVCIWAHSDSSLTVLACDIALGASEYARGIYTYPDTPGSDDPAADIVVSGCHVYGGGGSNLIGIYAQRANLDLQLTTIDGLTATQMIEAVDATYEELYVDNCTIHGGTIDNSGNTCTCGLYVNECNPYTISNSTIHGGEDGGARSTAIDIMDTEDVPGDCLIQDNIIDGGTGTAAVGISVDWADLFPTIDGNTIGCSGGTIRRGIEEDDEVSVPVAVTDNYFLSNLYGSPTFCYYWDKEIGAVTDIEALNELDTDGYNPANSVSGNTAGPHPAEAPSDADFIFVDGTNGSSGGTGEAADPLDDIQAGIAVAQAAGKDLCVAEGEYPVDSSVGTQIVMDFDVSIFGGYNNNSGGWTRDYSSYQTHIYDTATTAGLSSSTPLRTIECTYGVQSGPAPVLDGLFIDGAFDNSKTRAISIPFGFGTAVWVPEGASLGIVNCFIVAGNTDTAYGISTYPNSSGELGAVHLSEGVSVQGGASGCTVYGIYAPNAALVLADCDISGFDGSITYGIFSSYGTLSVYDSQVHGGAASNTSYAIHLPAGSPFRISDSSIHGGTSGGGALSTHAVLVSFTGVPGAFTYIENCTIDGGGGSDDSYGIRIYSNAYRSTIDGNTFSCTGSADDNRFGIYEATTDADPLSVSNNFFSLSTLSHLTDPDIGYYYDDDTGPVTTPAGIDALSTSYSGNSEY